MDKLLSIIIMVGVLGYFGLMTPKNLLPEKCVASPGFRCSEFTLNEGIGGKIILLYPKNSSTKL